MTQPRPVLPPRQTKTEYRENLARMISYLRERNIKVLMIQFNAGDAYNQAAIGLAHELEVPVIVYDGPRLDVVHPTSAGNRQIAEQLVETLQGMGALS